MKARHANIDPFPPFCLCARRLAHALVSISSRVPAFRERRPPSSLHQASSDLWATTPFNLPRFFELTRRPIVLDSATKILLQWVVLVLVSSSCSSALLCPRHCGGCDQDCARKGKALRVKALDFDKRLAEIRERELAAKKAELKSACLELAQGAAAMEVDDSDMMNSGGNDEVNVAKERRSRRLVRMRRAQARGASIAASSFLGVCACWHKVVRRCGTTRGQSCGRDL